MSPTATAPRTVDIRTLGACTDRKACVLKNFDDLADGEGVVVVNDHFPRGLLLHFEEQRAGRFEWTSLEEGPEVFRVQITKRDAPAESTR